jgi:hypothetical protein
MFAYVSRAASARELIGADLAAALQWKGEVPDTSGNILDQSTQEVHILSRFCCYSTFGSLDTPAPIAVGSGS